MRGGRLIVRWLTLRQLVSVSRLFASPYAAFGVWRHLDSFNLSRGLKLESTEKVQDREKHWDSSRTGRMGGLSGGSF